MNKLDGTTHWEGCWRDDKHGACARARVQHLEAALRDCYARWEWFLRPELPEPPVFDMDRIRVLLSPQEPVNGDNVPARAGNNSPICSQVETACEHDWHSNPEGKKYCPKCEATA